MLRRHYQLLHEEEGDIQNVCPRDVFCKKCLPKAKPEGDIFVKHILKTDILNVTRHMSVMTILSHDNTSKCVISLYFKSIFCNFFE